MIGGGAHSRKRRTAGHLRALLARADATTQVCHPTSLWGVPLAHASVWEALQRTGDAVTTGTRRRKSLPSLPCTCMVWECPDEGRCIFFRGKPQVLEANSACVCMSPPQSALKCLHLRLSFHKCRANEGEDVGQEVRALHGLGSVLLHKLEAAERVEAQCSKY